MSWEHECPNCGKRQWPALHSCPFPRGKRLIQEAVPRRYPDRPPFDGVPWSFLSKDERVLVTEWHTTDHAKSQP